MIKVVALLKRKPEMSRAAFLEHWSTTHARLITHLPGLRRYVQNHPLEHPTPWPYDGAAELWFDSVGDVARAFDGEAADAMRADELVFIDTIEWFLALEHEVPPTEGDAS